MLEVDDHWIEKGWYDEEVSNYDYENGTSFNDGLIDHFTQMVWDDTTSIGCGVTTFEEELPTSSGAINTGVS